MSDSNEVFEEKAKKHEVGIELMLKITKSVFFYEPIQVVNNCRRCTNRADFLERIHGDKHYASAVCMACRDRHVKKRFEHYLKKRQPDQRHYAVTADQARQLNFQQRKHL